MRPASCGVVRPGDVVGWSVVRRRHPGHRGRRLSHRDRAGRSAGGARRDLHARLPLRPDPGRRRRAVPGRLPRLDRRVPGDGVADAAADRRPRCSCREPAAPEATVVRKIDFIGAFCQPFSSFFSNNGLALGIVLLLFVGLFKLPGPGDRGDGRAVLPRSRATPSPTSPRCPSLYGVWIGIGGAFLGGVGGGGVRVPQDAARGRDRRGAVSNLAFLLMAQNPSEIWAFYAAISADNLFAGLRRRGADRLHVGADQSQLHRDPVRAAGVAGQPAGQIRRRLSGYVVEATCYAALSSC